MGRGWPLVSGPARELGKLTDAKRPLRAPHSSFVPLWPGLGANLQIPLDCAMATRRRLGMIDCERAARPLISGAHMRASRSSISRQAGRQAPPLQVVRKPPPPPSPSSSSSPSGSPLPLGWPAQLARAAHLLGARSRNVPAAGKESGGRASERASEREAAQLLLSSSQIKCNFGRREARACIGPGPRVRSECHDSGAAGRLGEY